MISWQWVWSSWGLQHTVTQDTAYAQRALCIHFMIIGPLQLHWWEWE